MNPHTKQRFTMLKSASGAYLCYGVGVKKILLITLFGLLFLSLASNLVRAVDQPWCSGLSVEDRSGGLVPCGRACNDPTTDDIDESAPCQLCHLFVMIEGIIDFLLFKIVPVLAVLMIAIGGGMYILSQGNPEMISRAKRLFTAIAIGLLIIYGAFIFIGFFLWFIGLADWTTDIYHNWWEKGFFEIPCP